MQLSGAARSLRWLAAGCAAIVLIAGCGTAQQGSETPAADAGAISALPQAHPQAVEPTAGMHASAGDPAAAPRVVGDVNAHAPSLAEVKRELKELNLCGGATSSADASPVVKSTRSRASSPIPAPSQTEGQLPMP